MARQSEWISLCRAVGHHDEGATSSTGSDGAAGEETVGDRDRDVDRVRAVFLSVSDYDHLAADGHGLDGWGGKKSFYFPNHPHDLFLVCQCDHEELVTLMEADHSIRE